MRTLFDAVEINSSFYRPHQRNTYARWAGSVPDDFRFSVKVPRTITHDLHLRHTARLLDPFLEEAMGLGSKLHGLLVQLPPGLVFDSRSAGTFFAMLRRRWAGGIACEPRHASWFLDKRDAFWQRHGIARVGADPALNAEARTPTGQGRWRYWRMHGSPRMYYSQYPPDSLRKLAAEVVESTAAESEAWVIFDNTAHGHATTDASALQRLLRRSI